MIICGCKSLLLCPLLKKLLEKEIKKRRWGVHKKTSTKERVRGRSWKMIKGHQGVSCVTGPESYHTRLEQEGRGPWKEWWMRKKEERRKKRINCGAWQYWEKLYSLATCLGMNLFSVNAKLKMQKQGNCRFRENKRLYNEWKIIIVQAIPQCCIIFV